MQTSGIESEQNLGFKNMSTAFASSVSVDVLQRGKWWLRRTCNGKAGFRTSRKGVRMSAAKPPEMPEEAKKAVKKGEQVTFWQGEWICVDCGFVYKKGRKQKFEDLPSSWKCPQCNAPKRRFAKKAGDFIAETSGTSNAPILIFSVAGLLATIAFGVWASQNL